MCDEVFLLPGRVGQDPKVGTYQELESSMVHPISLHPRVTLQVVCSHITEHINSCNANTVPGNTRIGSVGARAQGRWKSPARRS